MSRISMEDCLVPWHEINREAGEIEGRISALITKLLISTHDDMHVKEMQGVLTAVKQLSDADRAIKGLSYFCKPQPEWTGGNGTIMRAPHIVNG